MGAWGTHERGGMKRKGLIIVNGSVQGDGKKKERTNLAEAKGPARVDLQKLLSRENTGDRGIGPGLSGAELKENAPL